MDSGIIIKRAETKLPNVENYDKDIVFIPILKELDVTVSTDISFSPKDSGTYIVTYRKRIDHLNNPFWEFVSLDK